MIMEQNLYFKNVILHVPRLLGLEDRDPYSSTRGCFDRSYWAWKLKDFPDATMQRGVYPLSILYSYDHGENPYVHSVSIGEWCKAGILYCARIQHENGSFDQAFPREYSFGATAFLLYALVRSIPAISHLFSVREERMVHDMCEKAARFLVGHSETHGFISNHCAGAAAALAKSGALFRNASYGARAKELVTLIMKRQSSEGWFLEYEGPDPGYETLGISYLASYYDDTKDPDVIEAVKKSVDFLSYCVHPDGTLGGEYGSRNTEVFYPAGLEAFRRDLPLALSICRAMRDSIAKGHTAALGHMDDENFIPLLCNYAKACAEGMDHESSSVPLLPWQREDETTFFPFSKIFIKSTRAYYCVCNGSKGGTLKVFAKQPEVLRWDDGGYIGKTTRDILCTTQVFHPNTAVRYEQGVLTISSGFFQYPTMLPTPLKLFILRFLSLTVFHSVTLGNIAKGILVRMLITNKRDVGAALERTIQATETTIIVHDVLLKHPSLKFQWLEYGKKFSAMHMGSAKYFQPSQLHALPSQPFPLEEFNRQSVARYSYTIACS